MLQSIVLTEQPKKEIFRPWSSLWRENGIIIRKMLNVIPNRLGTTDEEPDASAATSVQRVSVLSGNRCSIIMFGFLERPFHFLLVFSVFCLPF